MPKKKEVTGTINLICDAGKAAPSPKLGQALGPKGVNMMEFCKKFNEATKKLEQGAPIPTLISIYKDKSFDISIKMPTLTYYIKKFAKIDKGSDTPGKNTVATLSIDDCKKIVAEKKADFNTNDIDKAVNIVAGAAKSLGVNVKL